MHLCERSNMSYGLPRAWCLAKFLATVPQFLYLKPCQPPNSLLLPLQRGLGRRGPGACHSCDVCVAEVRREYTAAVQEATAMWMVAGFEVMPCSIKRLKGEALEQIACKPRGDEANPEPQVPPPTTPR